MTVDALSVAQRLPSNPFSTRFTRPGSIAPLDASGQPLDLDALVDRLPAPGGCSAITGPHGHGKTSLLVAILENAGARGRPTTLVRVGSPSDAWGVLAVLARTIGALVDRALGTAPDILAHAAVDLVLRILALAHKSSRLVGAPAFGAYAPGLVPERSRTIFSDFPKSNACNLWFSVRFVTHYFQWFKCYMPHGFALVPTCRQVFPAPQAAAAPRRRDGPIWRDTSRWRRSTAP